MWVLRGQQRRMERVPLTPSCNGVIELGRPSVRATLI